MAAQSARTLLYTNQNAINRLATKSRIRLTLMKRAALV